MIKVILTACITAVLTALFFLTFNPQNSQKSTGAAGGDKDLQALKEIVGEKIEFGKETLQYLKECVEEKQKNNSANKPESKPAEPTPTNNAPQASESAQQTQPGAAPYIPGAPSQNPMPHPQQPVQPNAEHPENNPPS